MLVNAERPRRRITGGKRLVERLVHLRLVENITDVTRSARGSVRLGTC